MSSYFRPDPFDVEFLRLAEPDRDVRRPELFFAKKIPPYHIMPPLFLSGGIVMHIIFHDIPVTILSADLQLFAPRTERAPHQGS